MTDHLFSVDMTAYGGHGNTLDLGHIDGQTGDLQLDYGIAHNLGLSASVAYVAANYRGSDPESPMDNGKYHGSFQDGSLGVRYMVPWQGFAITPNLGYSFPLHTYATDGHTAVGRGNASFNAGVAVGRTLSPWASNVWIAAGYTHEFVKDVQQWGLDASAYSATAGWYPRPRFSVSGYFSYLNTSDGIDWFSTDLSIPGAEMNHDRAAKSLVRRAGGALGYELNPTMSLFVDVGGIVSGSNTHNGVSYTVGTNWNFLGPAIH